MVVIKIGKSSEKPTENIETSELKPYIKNKQDPYITAYFQLYKKKSLAFVIGGGSMYRFESKNTSYVNHPLEQNSSYIVFLRFFENAVRLLNIEICLTTPSCNIVSLLHKKLPENMLLAFNIF